MSNFKYTTLNEGEIRIIELQPGDDISNIQGSLKVASIGSSTPKRYSALSYCWGLDSQPRRTISLDGQRFEARQSLLEALQQLRSRDECARLWIDAICINQEDKEEKKSQLPLMSSIYSKAETVEIWLRTGEDNGELGLWSLASGELEAIATPRIELVLAGEGRAFVNCGNARVTWDALSLGIAEISGTFYLNGAFLRSLVPQREQPEGPPTAPGSNLELALLRNMLSAVIVSRGMAAMMLCGIRTAYSDRSATSRPRPTSAVGTILRSSRYAQATLPRDKIFGLCGLLGASAEEGLMKLFDKEADEVFFAATLHILQNDTHPNMYHEYPTIPPSRAEKSSVPSWTLDFSFTGTTYAELHFTSLTKFHISRERQDKLIFSSDVEELTADACIIDTITNVIDYAAVARVPDTPAAWDAFSLRFREAAGIGRETVLEMSWYDKDNVQSMPCHATYGFYVTSKGLHGLCLPSAQAGDMIARLFRGTGFEIPMVLRPKGHKRYSMVCAASVSEGWEEVCRVKKTVDPVEVVLV
ncbi:heterokaryon incompatibility protein-domain-containing protein [Podospora didyma]|uniref:Heterokaryon incompatibility protein-domain-containing protein n=1 Tax=Podospora didyma TaxID=330526 RepID=A0AAE0NZZ9_9PEZI|nr:heterokaryon incompatibility protein-domain-containing protein [Podospora didyma]